MTTTFTLSVITALSLLGACKQEPTASGGGPTAGVAPSSSNLKDPGGQCKPFSDPSITKGPPAGAVFGNGQTITIEYDGSKSKEGDSVFYQLLYFNVQGSLLPIGGAPFTGQTKGTFTTDHKVFESNAAGRPGCMKVGIVQDVAMGSDGFTGKQVELGTYPIKFEISP